MLEVEIRACGVFTLPFISTIDALLGTVGALERGSRYGMNLGNYQILAVERTFSTINATTAIL